MFQLFFEGGWLFMSLITIMAIIMFYFFFRCLAAFYKSPPKEAISAKEVYYIRFFGMLALVIGILGQVIGLYEAMKHIAAQGSVSQEMLAGGFRVSSITTLYGLIIFIIAHLIWFFMDKKASSSMKA